MKFSNFLFPDCRDPGRDGVVIDETLREAWLSDELGVDVIWLAEQLAILDNITKGRLIVGLGRGSSYNIYDYQGFGIDHQEAQARLEEAEGILVKAWTREEFEHRGRFWQLKVPMLRPRPYTKPHPILIRAASGEASLFELARQGRPFLMNVQSMAATRARVSHYRKTMREGGFDEERIARNLEQCWVWRNVFVGNTDAEAESVGRLSRRWSSRGRHCAAAFIARPARGSKYPRVICRRPAPVSRTASSMGHPRGSPRRLPKSLRSASAV